MDRIIVKDKKSVTVEKLPMEDMCQLSEKPTDDKYRSSYEAIAQIICRYATNPLIELVRFYEQVIFCFLTGNSDMHLKNFSLLFENNIWRLAPAYDMVPSALLDSNDVEELALTLNGKKNKLVKADFISAMDKVKISSKAQKNIFNKILKAANILENQARSSFLPEEKINQYIDFVRKRAERLI